MGELVAIKQYFEMEKIKLKPKLTVGEREDKIAFLRKQRDGAVIGTYRNTLADVYKTIAESLVAHSVCGLVSFCEEHGTTEHEKNLLKDYCLELEQLQYIQIDELGNVLITKALDF